MKNLPLFVKLRYISLIFPLYLFQIRKIPLYLCTVFQQYYINTRGVRRYSFFFALFSAPFLPLRCPLPPSAFPIPNCQLSIVHCQLPCPFPIVNRQLSIVNCPVHCQLPIVSPVTNLFPCVTIPFSLSPSSLRPPNCPLSIINCQLPLPPFPSPPASLYVTFVIHCAATM